MLNVEEIYAERVPRGLLWLLAIDARVKIVLASLALSITLLVPSSRLALGLTIVTLSGLWLLGIKGRHLWSRVGPALPVVAVLFLTRLFFNGGEPLLAVDLLGVPVVLYREGLEIGLLLPLRVLSGIALLVLLQAVTPVPKLVGGLRSLGLPAPLAELILLVFRYIFVLAEEARQIRDAARARLGLGHWRLAIHSYSGLAGMVLWRAFDRAENVHRAMRSRGYQGEMPFEPFAPLSRRDLFTGTAGGLVLLAILGLAYWG